MRRIAAEEYRAMPWANGRGTTQEIARQDRDGRLLWRLSLAAVTEDGPFSLLPGLARILTVVEGDSLELTGPGLWLLARPFAPVAFSGDTPVSARLLDGPVRDLNLMFDPRRLSATARLVIGPMTIAMTSGFGLLWLAPDSAPLGTPAGVLKPGDTGLLQHGEAADLPQGARALWMSLMRQAAS